MKKILPYIIIGLFVATISLFFFIHPPEYYFSKIPSLQENYSTKLIVQTQSGATEVFIDGESYGQGPIEATDLDEGQYEVRLERITTEETEFYESISVIVELLRGTETFINIEVGPKGFAHGYALYYSTAPNLEEDQGQLSFTTNAIEYTANINSDVYRESSYISLNTGEYDFSLKSDSYKNLEFPIIIREGYNLNIRGYQFPIPVNLEVTDNE